LGFLLGLAVIFILCVIIRLVVGAVVFMASFIAGTFLWLGKVAFMLLLIAAVLGALCIILEIARGVLGAISNLFSPRA